MKIFISSPKKGLEKERQIVIDTINNELKAFYQPIGMEYFMASPDTPKKVCLSELENTNIVILMIGPYYGSIDKETELSFTEVEYNEATDLGLDIFVFMKLQSGQTEWLPEDLTDEIKEKHREFVSKITQHYKNFYTPEELRSYIINSLRSYEIKKKYLPFVDSQEYFSAFLGNDKTFRHDYKLVGREKEIKELDEFVKSDKKIAILNGIGGIGKSKILYEFSKTVREINRDYKICFLRDYEKFDNRTAKQIPNGKCIIVLDDAQRYNRDNLSSLLSLFGNSDLYQRIKLILSIRPSGIDFVNMSLSRSINEQEIQRLDEIKVLSLQETKSIIENIIGNSNRAVINRLADISKDCPLVAIIGSKLVKDGKISLEQFLTSEEFQRMVLDKYLDELKGEDLNNPVYSELLAYISALGPIRYPDDSFVKKMASILNAKTHEIFKKIDCLRKKGLLLKTGRLLRVVPDVLGDHILYNACVSVDSVSTTFADKVYEEFHEIYFKNILRNISEIEWESKFSQKPIDVLGDIWKNITQSFIEASSYDRMRMLDEIGEAAFYRPNHVMKIINIAIDSPSPIPCEDKQILLLRDWSQKDVLEKIPRILGNIGYHLEYVKKCCKMLWDLGKDDIRELNPYPEHPIRILKELASYKIGIPVIYNEKVIEFVEELIDIAEIHNHKYSLLEIIDELLEKEGEFIESEGISFRMGTFELNQKNIAKIRKRAIDILEKCFSPSLPAYAIARAYESLIKALHFSIGSFGRVISEDEEKGWLPEQLRIIDILENGAKKISHPAVNVLIKKNLKWFQQHGRYEELKAKVTKLLNSIEEDYEFRLYRGAFYSIHEFDEGHEDFKEAERKAEEELRSVAKLLKEKEKIPEAIFEKLNVVIDELSKYKMDIKQGYLLSDLTEEYPDIGIEIYKLILKDPEKSLCRFSSSFLWPLKRISEYNTKLKALIKSGIDTKHPMVCLGIAHAYGWGGLIENFDDEDVTNIEDLINMKDKNILTNIFFAIAKIGKTNNEIAKKLLLKVKIEDEVIVEELCGVVDKEHGIPFETLSKEDIQILLSKFIPISDIFSLHSYYTDKFLGDVSNKYPDLAISFLLDRLEYAKNHQGIERYTPLPYLGFRHALKGISQSPDFDRYVKKVMEMSLGEDKNKIGFWLPRLFKAIADNYSRKSLDILNEWIKPGDKEKIESVVFLLEDVPDSFIFENYEFVGGLLLTAQNTSQECFEKVRGALYGIAWSGERHRKLGTPSEKNIILRDMGEKTATYFDLTHPANKFYEDVSELGEKEIKEEMEEDEEMMFE